MKLIVVILVITLLLFALRSYAQNQFVSHEDKQVQALCQQRDSLIICGPSIAKSGKGSGYRILVNVTNDRDVSYQLKHKLLKRYPDYIVYMSYQTPYFKLKIGDFLLKDDANAFNIMFSLYMRIPTTVVSDIITILNEVKKADAQPCAEDKSLLSFIGR